MWLERENPLRKTERCPKTTMRKRRRRERACPLDGGRWYCGRAEGAISLPRAGGRGRNDCRELAEIRRLDTASSPGKNITENLQTCNAHLGVLKPVSCLWGPTHCFLGRGLSLLRVSFPRPRLPLGSYLLWGRGKLCSLLLVENPLPSPPRDAGPRARGPARGRLPRHWSQRPPDPLQLPAWPGTHIGLCPQGTAVKVPEDRGWLSCCKPSVRTAPSNICSFSV